MPEKTDNDIDRNEPRFRAYKLGHRLEYSEKFISLSEFFTDYELNDYHDLEYCLNLKDINDKFIYENDIVENVYGEQSIVSWCDICCAFEIDEYPIYQFVDHFAKTYEQMINYIPELELKIIGNKYDTPELWMRLKNGRTI